VKNSRSLQVRELSEENKLNYLCSFIGKTQKVLVEKITQGIANGYGQHYIPVRFRGVGVQKNTIQNVNLTEIRGTGENMYLFGELND
jgi:threonylcarbamoyladenosine tRNA methylthiotransferase MtaB